MHSDHFKGLYNGFKGGYIYCSEKTAKLLCLKFPLIHSFVKEI